MKSWIFSAAAAVMAAAAPVAAQSVFFGSLHSHTSYSDGSGTPEDAYKAARAAGLDFFAITEHNHREADGSGPRRDGLLIATNPALYSGTPTSLVETADRLDDPNHFVTLYGQEYSTITKGGNHVNVIGAREVITVDNGRYDLLAAFANAHPDASGRPLLIQMNHPDLLPPGTSYGQFVTGESPHDFPNDAAWLRAMDPLVEMIEVFSGPALDPRASHKRVSADEGGYLRYLNLGFHLAPSSGHDNHFRNWGTSTDTRTGVIAARLTRTDIMAALRSRHAYATQDPSLRIVFRANGALQGDIVRAPAAGAPIALSVSIRDDDEPTARYRIEVLSDRPGGAVAGAAVSTTSVTGNAASVTLPPIPFAGRGQYVLLRVTQTNAPSGTDRAWTAPVWFE